MSGSKKADNCPNNCYAEKGHGVCTGTVCDCELGYAGADCSEPTCCPLVFILIATFIILSCCVLICCVHFKLYRHLPKCPGMEDRCKKLGSSFGSSRKKMTKTTPVTSDQTGELSASTEKGGGKVETTAKKLMRTNTTPVVQVQASVKKVTRANSMPVDHACQAKADFAPSSLMHTRGNSMPARETVDHACQANADFARNFLMNQIAHDSNTTVAGEVTGNLSEGLRGTATRTDGSDHGLEVHAHL